MTTNPLKIFCWDQNSEYARLVTSVFSLIPHEVRRIERDINEFFSIIQQNVFDLILIDNTLAGLQLTDVEQINTYHPGVDIILIEEDYQRSGDFHKYSYVHILSKKEVVIKLAPLLSELYSRISDKIYHSLNYQKLMQRSLESIEGLVVIANSAGRVIFVNQAASKLLNIEDMKNTEIFLQNLLADGAKIWKYVQEYLSGPHNALRNYPVQFVDGHNQKHARWMNFTRLALEKEYVLIDESSRQTREPALGENQDLSVIQRFSESISNELLNPVNVIFGRIQLLKQSMPHEVTLQRHIGGLERQVERINETIKRLVTFASLRRDAVPQKVHLNEIIERLKIDPAVQQRLNSFMERISFTPGKDIPVLQGLLSHFDMLIKNILELIFECAGNSGKLEISTSFIEDKDTTEKVCLTFAIEYNKPIFGDARSLRNQLKEERTLEGSIIKYIIHSYNGVYRIKNDTTQSEQLEIFFPVFEPNNKAEAR